MSRGPTEPELEEVRNLAAEMDLGREHREQLCLELIRARRVVHMLRTLRFRRRTPYQVLNAVDQVPDLTREAALALDEPGTDG